MLRYDDDFYDDEEYDEEDEIETKKGVINYKNIVTVIISFLVSQIELVAGFCPLGMAIFAANMSNKVPLVVSFVAILIGIYIKFGVAHSIMFVISAIIFTLLSVLFKNREKEDETISKKKLFFATFAVQLVYAIIQGVTVQSISMVLATTIATIAFYVVFTYGLYVILNIKETLLFSVEEIVGASLLGSIAISALGPITIYGLNIRNIICVLFVVILAWKNGKAIGFASGLAIGCTLALIGVGDLTLIVSYVVAGIVVGLVRKTGKIGIIAAHILTQGLIMYLMKGQDVALLAIEEAIISSLILLFIPKKAEMMMDDIVDKTISIKDTANGEYSFVDQEIFRIEEKTTLTEEEKANEKEENIFETFVNDVTNKACVNCENKATCKQIEEENKYFNTIEVIKELIEKESINVEKFDEIVNNACKKSEDFVQALNGTYELYKDNDEWKKNIKNSLEMKAEEKIKRKKKEKEKVK